MLWSDLKIKLQALDEKKILTREFLPYRPIITHDSSSVFMIIFEHSLLFSFGLNDN